MNTAPDLGAVPFVDAHMHAPLRRRPTELDDYRWYWYEGNREDARLAADLVPYRWAIRELARELGCEEDEEAVLEALAERDDAGWLRESLRAAAVVGLVVDTGLPPPELALTPVELAEASGVPVAAFLRLEFQADRLLEQTESFGEFLERFDDQVWNARVNGYTGLKSVIAYRSGLAIEPVERAEAENGLARELERRRPDAPVRLTDKRLLDFLFLRALAVARRERWPIQLHTGYGDRDMDLRLSDPLLLRPLLESEEACGVPLVLLHGAYPFTREAALLAAVHRDVYLYVATCIPPLGWPVLVEMWRTATAVAPLSRIHASTDAAGLPEHIVIGARRARSSLAVALAELCACGALGVRTAEDAAVAILGGNAQRLYFEE